MAAPAIPAFTHVPKAINDPGLTAYCNNLSQQAAKLTAAATYVEPSEVSATGLVLSHAATTVWDRSQGWRASWTINSNTTLDVQNVNDGEIGWLVVTIAGAGGYTITVPGNKPVDWDINGLATGYEVVLSFVRHNGILRWDFRKYGVPVVASENGTPTTLAYNSPLITFPGTAWPKGSGNFWYTTAISPNNGQYAKAVVSFKKGIRFTQDPNYVGAQYTFVVDGVIAAVVTSTVQGQVLFEVHPNTTSVKTFEVYKSGGPSGSIASISSNSITIWE
ncbi:hypothetical protein HER32_06730 [Hymenobacter sp. BT18]|uniref:hypothetical protein n=1 Tax=Hymenobacter sp. BT18 TaxID=2835648 RepID=UPI00143EEA00|nr:hypothetical protein [Hymenobacter sp. BT18]QIX60888.1 hypothetical protein HER32_06730 [Hymenobacter sp. BT18]